MTDTPTLSPRRIRRLRRFLLIAMVIGTVCGMFAAYGFGREAILYTWGERRAGFVIKLDRGKWQYDVDYLFYDKMGQKRHGHDTTALLYPPKLRLTCVVYLPWRPQVSALCSNVKGASWFPLIAVGIELPLCLWWLVVIWLARKRVPG